MRYHLRIAVHGHGKAKRETQDERTKGLQAVQPFRHKNGYSSFEEYRGLRELAGDFGGGCRGSHELGDGCRRYILAEKAGEALLVKGFGRSGELDGEFWIGSLKEGFVWRD